LSSYWTHFLISIRQFSLPGDLSSGGTAHTRKTARKEQNNVRAQGTCVLQRFGAGSCSEYSLGVAQARVTDVHRHSACSHMMSCSTYLISIEIMTTLALDGNGTYWCTYVEDGDKLYSNHHTVSISKFSAQTDLLSRRIWVSGQPFLSFLMYRPLGSLPPMMKTMPLLHSSTPIVYVLLRCL
jgi:hypothetical protein